MSAFPSDIGADMAGDIPANLSANLNNNLGDKFFWATEATRRMNRMYRRQRHIYDGTRRYYLLGRDQMISELRPRRARACWKSAVEPAETWFWRLAFIPMHDCSASMSRPK